MRRRRRQLACVYRATCVCVLRLPTCAARAAAATAVARAVRVIEVEVAPRLLAHHHHHLCDKFGRLNGGEPRVLINMFPQGGSGFGAGSRVFVAAFGAEREAEAGGGSDSICHI